MKKLLLLLCALLTLGGSTWAATYTITYGTTTGSFYNGSNAVVTSGWVSKWVSNEAGKPAVTLTVSANNVNAENGRFAPGQSKSSTYSLSVEDGYRIAGFSLNCPTFGAEVTVTPNGKSAVVAATGQNIVVNSCASSFVYSGNNSGRIQAGSNDGGSFTITVVDASDPTVNVTYNLYESDGTTLVNSDVVVQEANSAVSLPSSLAGYTYYDYATSGTIGESDCAIKVIRTLKSGVVISNSNLSNTKCYNITTNGRGAWVVPNEATAVTSTTNAGLAISASDTKQQFAFILYEGNYYLYSVSQSKFISKSGNYTTLTEEPGNNVTLLTSTGSFSYPVVVAFQNGSYHAGISNGYNPAVITHYNSLSDDGNRAYITEAGDFDPTAALAALDNYFHPSYTVTYVVKDVESNTLFTSDPVGTTLGANITTLPAEYQITAFYNYNNIDLTVSDANTTAVFTATLKDDAPVKFTTDATNPYYYNLNIRSKYLVYDAGATGEVTLQTSSEPFNANASWAFIGEPYAGFKVINKTKGTGSYLTYTSIVTGGNSGNNNIQFVAAGDFTNQYWNIDTNTSGIVLRMKENTNIYFHHDNGSNFLRTCSLSEWAYVHTDAGSTIVAASDEDVLIALYDALSARTYGDGVGEYTATSYSASEVQSTIAGVATVIASEQTSAYEAAYNALANLASISTLNLPDAGFYRIQGKTSSKYLAAGLATNSKFNMTTATDATTIFYFDGSKLVNFGSGMANGMNSSSWAWVTGDNASTVAFHDGKTNGGYGIQSATAYFYDNGDNTNSTDRGTSVDMSTGNTRYRSWNLTEITTLPVTISAVGYATLYAPVALTIPTGVTAYTGEISGEYLVLSEVSTTIPANTPVVLEGTAGTYNFDITTGGSVSATNNLSGNVAAIAWANGNYTLQYDGSDVASIGFYANAPTDNIIPGFKAYLASASGVKGYSLELETAVKAIEAATNPGKAVYDLNGRRVENPTKGLYIVNGKKVIIK